MSFLKNTWYMIGWAAELESGLVHRRIVGEDVLVYRLSDGSIAAIEDRCPHRFVPLHRGRQVGDTIECGYHGLCFAANGNCVKNPVENAIIPKAARVRAFPAVSRYGVLWVWLGDPAAADPSTIVNLDFLVDPKRSTVQGYMLTRADSQLAIDNLSDLSHVQYVHAEFQASDVFHKLKSEVFQNGEVITTRLTLPTGKPAPIYSNAVSDIHVPIDIVNEVEWHAPSVAILRVRGFRPGERDEALFDVKSAHIISAETEGSCHYFFGNTRDFALGDPAADEKIRHWQRIAFIEQDKPMLEAQQAFLGQRDLLELNPVLLATDAGSVRIRRTLRKLIETEQEKA